MYGELWSARFCFISRLRSLQYLCYQYLRGVHTLRGQDHFSETRRAGLNPVQAWFHNHALTRPSCSNLGSNSSHHVIVLLLVTIPTVYYDQNCNDDRLKNEGLLGRVSMSSRLSRRLLTYTASVVLLLILAYFVIPIFNGNATVNREEIFSQSKFSETSIIELGECVDQNIQI